MARRMRAGLRAFPKGAPHWLRWVRSFLGGLRRKHPLSYRAIRGRVIQAWPQLAPTWARLTAAAMTAPGTRYLTKTDGGRLCAVVLEAFAWWAAEERMEVSAIREARRQLLDLQRQIDTAVDDLCAAIHQTDALCTKYGLRVEAPYWNDDLLEVLTETAHRFGRWGTEPAVAAMLEREAQSFYIGRPRVADIVRVAHNAGLLQCEPNPPPRWPDGSLVRLRDPEVIPTLGFSAEALRKSRGSSAMSEAAQLRQLFAELRKIALDNGWEPTQAGPLVWLTDEEFQTLCQVTAGNDKGPTKRWPWGEPSTAFDLDTVRKAREDFMSEGRGKAAR